LTVNSNFLLSIAYTTDYQVAASDTNSCPVTIYDLVNVHVIIPDPLITTPDTLVYLGTSAHLYSVGGISYEWDPTTYLSDGFISDPVASPEVTTTYYVYATTADGCKISDSLTIVVVIDPLVTFPNAFTPNTDGTNDYFKPIVLGYFETEIFDVFNRWGQLIYQTNDISIGWDGTHDGSESEIGTYVYYLRGKSLTTGKPYFLKGNVVLLR